MPRYTAITPQFDPIDYQTRIRPLEQYKEEYDKRADALDEQAILADAIGGLIDENTDPGLADIYKRFSQNLGDTVSNLVETGDLGSSRRALSQLRRDYANQLVPIKTAYEDRAKEAEEYRKKKLADDTYIGTDPMSHSLSDYYKGARPNDKGLSGATLYNAGAADAKAATSRRVLRDKWALDKGLGSQYFSQMIYQGWSQDEVMAALKDFDPNASQEDVKEASDAVKYLQDAMSRISGQARLQDFGDYATDPEARAKIDEAQNYILNGLLSGMTYDERADYKNYDPSMWLDYKIKKKKLEGEEEGIDYLPYEIIPMADVSGMINTDKAKEDIQFLSDVLADPNFLGKEKVYYEGTPEEYGKNNEGELLDIAKRYGLSLNYTKDNSGKYTIDSDSFISAGNTIKKKIAEAALISNVAQYKTKENDNLVEAINNRAETVKGLKHVKRNGTTEAVGKLPKGGVFRLNPKIVGTTPYFEYVITPEGATHQEIYRVPTNAVSNVSEAYVTAYLAAVAAYRQNPTDANLKRANAARHNAMIDAYSAAEDAAKVRSKTDSKL